MGRKFIAKLFEKHCRFCNLTLLKRHFTNNQG